MLGKCWTTVFEVGSTWDQRLLFAGTQLANTRHQHHFSAQCTLINGMSGLSRGRADINTMLGQCCSLCGVLDNAGGCATKFWCGHTPLGEQFGCLSREFVGLFRKKFVENISALAGLRLWLDGLTQVWAPSSDYRDVVIGFSWRPRLGKRAFGGVQNRSESHECHVLPLLVKLTLTRYVLTEMKLVLSFLYKGHAAA